MLSEAAELEHGIMCCYLYCAFSMKRDVVEGVTEEQLTSIQGWRKTIMEIAAEEMLHTCLACTFSRRWAALLICAGPIFLQAPGPTPILQTGVGPVLPRIPGDVRVHRKAAGSGGG